MQLYTGKSDWRDTVTQLCVAASVILTFVAIASAWSLEVAVNLVLAVAAGYLLVRLAWRSGIRVPAPRSLSRVRGAIPYRRMASDQPFRVRLGWTSDAEPGGPLPDARRVTPFGQYGGGLYTDGFVAGLVVAAIFGMVLGTAPQTALILPVHVLAWGLLGLALVFIVRWLRRQ